MFVHLHVHTQYSLLQGALGLEKLIARAKEYKMPALAITDTHNIFGAVEFFKEAKANGIKPIIGSEVYVAATEAAPVHHLVLLCKNAEGYRNLCELLTESYKTCPPPQKGQSAYIPRFTVTRSQIEKCAKGLIALSGCIRGEIPAQILMGFEDEALKTAKWYKSVFGEDFFLEVQSTQIPEQEQTNVKMRELGQKLSIPIVATCDCHYLEPKDAESHEVFQCIEHGRELDYDRPKSLVPSEYDFKSPEEMIKKFENFPEAIANTLEIAKRCEFEFKFKGPDGKPIYHLPKFRPDGVAPDAEFDLNAYFANSAREGMQARFKTYKFSTVVTAPDWPDLSKKYAERLEYELAMIIKTGFAGYYMIVADFVSWAKKNEIPVGPGRGSGAGSLVAYALGIVDIDPVEFSLLFERFINPERISMPDFDIDFCPERREEVIQYVTRKYGTENVTQIITFGKLQAKAAVKDVGRVLGLSFQETDQITKLFPNELGITIERAIDQEPKLQELIEKDVKTAKWFEYARSLEGLYRNAGIHAAGVIITEKPLVNYCPLFMGRDDNLVIQYDKDSAEAIGLIKFDFLGLKTLTVIDYAVKLIKKLNPEFDIEKISMTDPKVYALFKSGDTDGVFQVESSGMKDLCMRMVPSNTGDLTAIMALFRPGPLGSGMVDDFIDGKHGRKLREYVVPELEPILKDTYGVMLYQEQVMQIARELAGYSLGQADMLRRAMGKKLADEMDAQCEKFMEGAKTKGIDPAKAKIIFDLMAKFANYGFNKSHSAAYGLITYQTAYLKTHFPAPFMAALMTTEMGSTDNLAKYIGDCRTHGLKVLPPDVNLSERKFSVENGNQVRYGLEAIKGVGGAAVDSLLEAREKGGPFKSFVDFAIRVSTRKVNKKVLENLIIAGAFDQIGEANRPSLLASVESVLEIAAHEQAEKESGQDSLFEVFTQDSIKPIDGSKSGTRAIKQEPDWTLAKRLASEREVMGLYISGHPMENWQKICEDWLGWNMVRIKKLHEEKRLQPKAEAAGGYDPASGGYRRPKLQEIRIGAVITDWRELMTKKGTRMAIAVIEDLYSKMDMLIFSEPFTQFGGELKRAYESAEAVVLSGELDLSDEAPKMLCKGIEWAEVAHRNRVQQVVLKIPMEGVTVGQLRELKTSLIQHRGKCPVRIQFVGQNFATRLDLPKTTTVSGTPQMVESVNKIFGVDVVSLQ